MLCYIKKALFCALLGINFLSYSQGSLSGTISSGEEPGAFATILLLQESDSSLVKGSIADASGAFQIKNVPQGRYLLKVSSVGYLDSYLQVALESSSTKDLGIVQIEENAAQLDEVVVQTERPLFEQKIDRTVVNVQSSITASAGTALDVLEKSPGVTVDRSNNSLALSGKQGVRVMINGKISRMPMNVVVQMLNGMNAENLEKVELITTPPAKYEAEGDAGLINIVLKKTEDEGTNGSFSVTAGYGDKEKNAASINLNHRNKKLNVFGNYSFRRDHTFQVFGNNRILENNTTNETDTRSNRDPVTITNNAQVGIDYQAGEKLVFGANFTYAGSDWDMDALNNVIITDDGQLTSRIALFNQEINNIQYYVGNVNFSFDLSERSNLTMDVDRIIYDSDNPTNYQQFDYDDQNQEVANSEFRSSKITPLKVWVPRVDYSLSLGEGLNLEAGLKAAINDLDNDVSVDNLQNGVFVRDPELSNIAFLNEDIFAAYASLSFKLFPSTDAKVGFRYEHTITDIDTPTEENIVYRDFGRMFPSIFINKKINDDNSWVLSYSRRITRPGFQDIAPFVIFLDPNTFWTGNEALLPSITDAYRAEYRLKSYLIAFQYSRDDDAIARFQPRIAEDNERQLTSAENMKYRDNFNVSLTFPIKITDWWDMQYNILGFYQKTFVNHLEQEVELQVTSLSLNGSNAFKLPRNWKFEISGFYNSPSYFGISRFKAAGSLNFGIEKMLNKDKGTFRFTLTDALNTMNFIGETLVPEENINVRRLFDLEGQIFNLTYSRNFGNNKLKRIRNKRNASSEEQQRL